MKAFTITLVIFYCVMSRGASFSLQIRLPLSSFQTRGRHRRSPCRSLVRIPAEKDDAKRPVSGQPIPTVGVVSLLGATALFFTLTKGGVSIPTAFGSYAASVATIAGIIAFHDAVRRLKRIEKD
jgi:hypothetical protein